MNYEQIIELMREFKEDLKEIYLSHDNGNDLISRAMSMLRLRLKNFASPDSK